MTPHRTQNEAPQLTPKKAPPVRQCAVTRERLPQTQLLRFACGLDGQVVPDLQARLPGRGVWIKPDKTLLEDALKRGVFQRAFDGQVTGLEGLVELVEARLADACLKRLGMARRAGDIILGFDKVRAELRKKSPGYLIEARDGSADGRAKIFALARGLYDKFQVLGAFTSHELSTAFGRTGVIHGLMKRGPFAHNMHLDYARLTGFRDAPDETWISVNTRLDQHSETGSGPEAI